MIKAIVFDLDGTLVQTEILKAMSYAKAAVKLRPKLTEAEVVNGFKEVVGKPRKVVAQALMKKFRLEKAAREMTPQFEVATPWQAFVQIRLKIYHAMIEDPQTLLKYRCPYNLGLLKWARKNHFKTGLATMSHCPQANRVLKILEIEPLFDFIATKDDVEAGKPDPEIYSLVAAELKVKPQECLVIEDSVSGIKAALAAGMGCISVTTDFTRKSVYDSALLPEKWIVDDPKYLRKTVKAYLNKVTQKKKAG